jgi:hypothetical protein
MTNAIQTKGSLLREANLAGLVKNTVVDGIVQEGQASYAILKVIEEMNNHYEKFGTGNKMLDIYKDRVAYTGDRTIKGQIKTAYAVTGGIRVEFSKTDLNTFRAGGLVYTRFGATNMASILEAGPGYIVVMANTPGYTPVTAADFPAGVMLIQPTRSIGTRGTKTPEGVYDVPQTWENYPSIVDDGYQMGLYDSQSSTILAEPNKDYFVSAPVSNTMQAFFTSLAMHMFVSQSVNPEDNNFTLSRTRGLNQQFRTRSLYAELTSDLTSRSEFESYVRSWKIRNPGSDPNKTFIATGAIGMAKIGNWYRDEIKYDSTIAISYTGGELTGLNATRIPIAGFEFVNVVHFKFLNMDMMGEKTSIPGFENLPKAAANFYFWDCSAVNLGNGRYAPAFQKFYFKGSKYWYSFQNGLTPMNTPDQVAANATPLTQENLEITSTDNDFSNFRIYSIFGINCMNPSAQGFLENLV